MRGETAKMLPYFLRSTAVNTFENRRLTPGINHCKKLTLKWRKFFKNDCALVSVNQSFMSSSTSLFSTIYFASFCANVMGLSSWLKNYEIQPATNKPFIISRTYFQTLAKNTISATQSYGNYLSFNSSKTFRLPCKGYLFNKLRFVWHCAT